MKQIFSWKDCRSWPKDWPRFCCEPDDPKLKTYGEQLRNSYSSICCYHGARPANVQAYYESGLRLTNSSGLVSYAKAVFSDPIFPAITENEILQAIEELGCGDSGKLFLTLDDRNLLENAGHYLIYGSEFVMSIAGHLTGHHHVDCQQLLKAIGKPTVFELNIPTKWVSASELSQLARSIGIEEPNAGEPGVIDFTLVLRRSLPASCVVGHYHPRDVRDWHRGGSTYNWEA